MYHAHVSKNNSNHEKQVILLMIPNGDKREANTHGRWHCLKKTSDIIKRNML